MRQYGYITIGAILAELKRRDCPISINTFKRLMVKEKLFEMKKTAAGWYVASQEEKKTILKIILLNYKKIG
ncbi:MAG: hypothetical protein WC549_00510 [Actinomycetota bacterium]